MPHPEYEYLDLLALACHGSAKADRTGTGTWSVFGHQMRFDLRDGFPLLTTKRVHFPAIVAELLWFLSGSTNVRPLQEAGVSIWDEWADANGDLGPIYGRQWRSWSGVDQIAEVLRLLRDDPDSRRMVVSAWNPADLPLPGVAPFDQAARGRMALAPCHCLFQFYTRELSLAEREAWLRDHRGVALWVTSLGRTPRHRALDEAGVPARVLSCQVYQRSADVFLGVPFNVASYALLTHLVAQSVGMAVGDLIWTGGDCHLYVNHRDQANEQLSRKPRLLPSLRLDPSVTGLFRFRAEHVTLEGYDPHPRISAPVAV